MHHGLQLVRCYCLLLGWSRIQLGCRSLLIGKCNQQLGHCCCQLPSLLLGCCCIELGHYCCLLLGGCRKQLRCCRLQVGMKCVALAGRHPVYELSAADLVVRDLAQLSFINLKQLFAAEERVSRQVCVPAVGHVFCGLLILFSK